MSISTRIQENKFSPRDSHQKDSGMYFRLKLHEISASHLLDICQKSLGSDPLDDCLEGEGSREVRQGMNEGVLEMHLTRLPFNLIFRQKQIEECLENISRKIKKRGNFLNVILYTRFYIYLVKARYLEEGRVFKEPEELCIFFVLFLYFFAIEIQFKKYATGTFVKITFSKKAELKMEIFDGIQINIMQYFRPDLEGINIVVGYINEDSYMV